MSSINIPEHLARSLLESIKALREVPLNYTPEQLGYAMGRVEGCYVPLKSYFDAQASKPLEQASKPEHKITREHHGIGLDSYIIPVCSCGWRGTAEYAHNDYQYTNLSEQEMRHTREARK